MYEYNAFGYWSSLAFCLTKGRSSRARLPVTALIHIFIAPAYSRVRYRSPNFCPSVRSSVRPSTFTSKFGFLNINDSCESQTLHKNCP